MAQRIVIDAGHNGISDPGAVYNGRRESDDNLDMALAVGDILARNGFDVVYTRTGNNNQTVQQKAQLANDADADLFVSIHRNDSPYPGQYNGVQTLIFDRTGIKLPMAENINRQLEEVGYRNINVETRPNLAVLRRTRMPALLVEVGFLNSDVDNQLFDTRFQETAQAIADGIMETLDAAAGDTAGGSSGEGDSSEDSGNSSQDPGAARPLYRVQVGAFYNLQNAVALEQELKRMGYNTWIVTV